MSKEKYSISGEEYSSLEVEEFASNSGMDLKEYISITGAELLEDEGNGDDGDDKKGDDKKKKSGKSNGAQTEDAAAVPDSSASKQEDGSSESRKTKTIIGPSGKPVELELYKPFEPKTIKDPFDPKQFEPKPAVSDYMGAGRQGVIITQDAKDQVEIQESNEALQEVINSAPPAVLQDLAEQQKIKEAKIQKEQIEKYKKQKATFQEYNDVVGTDLMLSEEGVNLFVRIATNDPLEGEEYTESALSGGKPRDFGNLTAQAQDLYGLMKSNNGELLGINISDVTREYDLIIQEALDQIKRSPGVLEDIESMPGGLNYDNILASQVYGNAFPEQQRMFGRAVSERRQALAKAYKDNISTGENYQFISDAIMANAAELRMKDLEAIAAKGDESSIDPGATQYQQVRKIMAQSVEVDDNWWGGTETGAKANVGLIEETDELLGLLDGTDEEIESWNKRHPSKKIDQYENTRSQILDIHKANLEGAGLDFKTTLGLDFELFVNPETKEVLKFKKGDDDLESFLDSDLSDDFVNAENIDILQTSGVIPSSSNAIMEEMANKEFEIVYLAKQLYDNLDTYRKDVSAGSALSNFFETIFTGQVGWAEMENRPGGYLDDIDLRKLLQAVEDGKLTYLPKEIEGSPRLQIIVDLLNKKSNEFDVLSQAYLLNFNPLNLEDDNFFDGVKEGASEQFANPAMSKMDKRAVFFDWVKENFPDTEFSQDEIDAVYNKTFLNKVGYGTPGFLAIIAEMAITRGMLGGAGLLKRIKGAGSLFNNLLFGTGRVGRFTEKYMVAFIEELAILKARNVAFGGAYDADPMSLLFAFAPVAGIGLDKSMLKLLESGKVDQLMNLMAYVPGSAQRLVKDAVGKPITGAAVMTAGEVPVGLWDVVSGAPNPQNPDQDYDFKTFVGHILDPEAFAEKAALCFVTKNAVPIKIARNTFNDVVREVNAVTGSRRYKQNLNKSIKDLNTSKESLVGDYQNKINKAAKEQYKKIGVGEGFLINLKTLGLTNKELAEATSISDLITKVETEVALGGGSGTRAKQEAINNLRLFGKNQGKENGLNSLRELIKVHDAKQSLLLDFEYENFKTIVAKDKGGDVTDKDINLVIQSAKSGAPLSSKTVRTLNEIRSKSVVKKILEDAGVDPQVIDIYSNYTEVSNYIMAKGRQNAIDFSTPEGKKYIDNTTEILKREAQLRLMKARGTDVFPGEREVKKQIEVELEELKLKEDAIIKEAKIKAEDRASQNLKRTIENRNEKGIGESFAVKGQQEVRNKLEELKDNKTIDEKQYNEIIENMDKGTVYDALNIKVKEKLPNGEEVEKVILLADAELIKQEFETGKGPHEDEHQFTNHLLENLGIKGNEAKEKQFVDKFIDTFTDAQKEKILDAGLRKHPSYKKNKSTLEWFNYYVEAIVKGDIKIDDIELEQQMETFEDLINDTHNLKGSGEVDLTVERYKEIIKNHTKNFMEGGSYGDISQTVKKPTTSQIASASSTGYDVTADIDAAAKIEILKAIEQDKTAILELKADARLYPDQKDFFDKEIKKLQDRIDKNQKNLTISDKNDQAVLTLQGKGDGSMTQEEAWGQIQKNKIISGTRGADGKGQIGIKEKGRLFIQNHPTTQDMAQSDKQALIDEFRAEVDYEVLKFTQRWDPNGAPFGAYIRDLTIKFPDILKKLQHKFEFTEDASEYGGASETKQTELVKQKTEILDEYITPEQDFVIQETTADVVRAGGDYKDMKKAAMNNSGPIAKELGTGEKYTESLLDIYPDLVDLVENENDWLRLRNWNIFYESTGKRVQVKKGKEDFVYITKIPTQKDFIDFMTFEGDYATNPKTGLEYTNQQKSNKTSQRRLKLAELIALNKQKQFLNQTIDNQGVYTVELPSGETVNKVIAVEDISSRTETNPEKIREIQRNAENQKALANAGTTLRAYDIEYEVDIDASSREYEEVTDQVAEDIFLELENQGIEPRQFQKWADSRKESISNDTYEQWKENETNGITNRTIEDIVDLELRKQADLNEKDEIKNFKKGIRDIGEKYSVDEEFVKELEEVSTPTYKYNKKNRTMDVDKLNEERKMAYEFQKFLPNNAKVVSGGDLDAYSGQATYGGYGVQGLTNLKTGEPLERIKTTQQFYGTEHVGSSGTSHWDGVRKVKGSSSDAAKADQIIYGTKKVQVEGVDGKKHPVKVIDPELQSFEARQELARKNFDKETQDNKVATEKALAESERLFLEEGKEISEEEYKRRLKYLATKNQADTSIREGKRKLSPTVAIEIPTTTQPQEYFTYTDPSGNEYKIVIPERKSQDNESINYSYKEFFGDAFMDGPTKGTNSKRNMSEKTKVEHAKPQLESGLETIENLISGESSETPAAAVYARRNRLDELDAQFTPGGKSLKLNRDKSALMDIGSEFENVYTIDSNYTKTIKEEVIDKVIDRTGLTERQVLNRMNDQSKLILADAVIDPSGKDLATEFIEDQVRNYKEYDNAEKQNTESAPDPLKKVIRDSAVDGTTGQKRTAELLDNTRDKLNRPEDESRPAYMYDMDGVLVGKSGERTIAKLPDGTELRLNNEEYMQQYKDLQAKGAEFDYSEFTELKDWLPGPKYEEFKRLIEEGKADQVFIVTARFGAEESIYKAFKEAGLEIPIENIKCCGGDEGKMLVYCERIEAGDNELHMSDDKWENMDSFKYVVDQCPWVVGKGTWVNEKGDVDPWAKPPITSTVDASGTNTYETPATGWEIVKEQERLLDNTFGKDRAKGVSSQEGRVAGKNKNTFKITPYSARHAINLTSKLYGTGQSGKNSIAFYDKYFYEPYDKAMLELASMRVSMSNDYTALRKQHRDLGLNKEAFKGYTREEIVRMNIWNEQGSDVPGVSKETMKEAQEYIKNDPDLNLFKLWTQNLNKVDRMADPNEFWRSNEGGSLGKDLDITIDTKGREQALTQWEENKKLLFSEDRLAEMEANLGPKWRSAMDSTLERMKTGKSDSSIKDPNAKKMITWLNGASAAALFLNRKSGVLQMLSMLNYANSSDNNILKMTSMLAQPKFYKQVVKTLKSDYVKNRIKNREMGVAEGEFAKGLKNFDDKYKSLQELISTTNILQYPKKFLKSAMDLGFSITSAMDAFAIATGGSTLIVNRQKTYEKQGYSPEEAYEKAFVDFRTVSESNQQSYDQKNLAQQQVQGYSRAILNFLNTTMLYNNRIVEAAENIKSGRGSKKDVFQLANYVAIQPMLFAMAKDALLWLLMDDEIPADVKAAETKKKSIEALYAVLENLVNGTGITGKVVTTMYAMGEKANEALERTPEGKKVNWNKSLGDVGEEVLQFATSIDMKISKLQSAGYAAERGIKKEEGFLEGNNLEAGLKTVTAITNFAAPEYILRSIEDMQLIMDERTTVVQKIALGMGWSKYALEIEGDIGKSQGIPQNYEKAIKKIKQSTKANNKFGGSNFGGSNFKSPTF